MKTYARRGQALMALLLIFTLFIGLLPAPALAAVWEKEGENTYVVSEDRGKTGGRFFCLDTFSIL